MVMEQELMESPHNSHASAAATDDINPGHGSSISITNISTVYPATPTEKQTMFLACCDLVCRSYPYINRIFFYEMGCSRKETRAHHEEGSADDDDDSKFGLDQLRSGHDYDYNAVVASLKESLGRVLVQYYPLAGRLCMGKDEEGGRLQIDCSDQGVEMVEATADLPFSHLQRDNFQYRGLFWKLATRSDMLRSDYTDLPILSIQVTKFKDGGLAIGVSLSHVVCDAQSFYDFVRSWAESCRLGDEYEPRTSMLPKHMRTALSIENIESWVRKLMPDESLPSNGSLAKSSCTGGIMEELQEMKLKFRINIHHHRPGLDELKGNMAEKEADAVGPVMEIKQQAECLGAHDKEEQADYQQLLQVNGSCVNGESTKVAGGRLHSKGVVDGSSWPRASYGDAPIMEKQQDEEDHREPVRDEELVQRVFWFSREALKELKEEANRGWGPAGGYDHTMDSSSNYNSISHIKPMDDDIQSNGDDRNCQQASDVADSEQQVSDGDDSDEQQPARNGGDRRQQASDGNDKKQLQSGIGDDDRNTYKLQQYELKSRLDMYNKIPFTTFEAFCAHWWRALIRAKLEAGLVEAHQEVFLLIPVNARIRFLNLPASYFGNCLDGAMARAAASAVAWAPSLAAVAGLVRAAIAARASDPTSFLAYVARAEAQLRRPRAAIPHFDRHGLFHVVDSPRYSVYCTDFGWGPPSAVRAEGFRFGAEVQILEAPPEPAGRPAGFHLFCALPTAAMIRLQQDPSFVPC